MWGLFEILLSPPLPKAYVHPTQYHTTRGKKNIKSKAIALPDPTLSALQNRTASMAAAGHIFAALWVLPEFISGEHRQMQKDGRTGRKYTRWQNISYAANILNKAMVNIPDTQARRL